MKHSTVSAIGQRGSSEAGCSSFCDMPVRFAVPRARPATGDLPGRLSQVSSVSSTSSGPVRIITVPSTRRGGIPVSP